MPADSSWMIYGANGYSGELIARQAVARGHQPILAGRNRDAVEKLAGELSCESRIFKLDRIASRSLEGVNAVIHCAGPFSATADPMVRACMEGGTHYMDITGEIAVFESILRRDREARAAGIALIPGVGFDVVPTDCLAAMLAQALPTASTLSLAFYARGGRLSRGTTRTMIEGLPHGGAIRTNGRIVAVPVAFDSREIPFSCGARNAMTIPWGDVSTAWHTTGIPDIRVYSAASESAVTRLRMLAPVLKLLRLPPLLNLVQFLAARRGGPDSSARAQSRGYLWGEAAEPSGTRVSLTMETPDGYTFTSISAVLAMERVLSSAIKAGAHTPARALGAQFVREISGVKVGSIQHSNGPP